MEERDRQRDRERVDVESINRNSYNEKIKQLQPGFILSFASCKILKDVGCEIWDLGGVDLCPLMRYKIDLTGDPVQRPLALALFRTARDNINSNRNSNGHCNNNNYHMSNMNNIISSSNNNNSINSNNDSNNDNDISKGDGSSNGDIASRTRDIRMLTAASGGILISDLKFEHLIGGSGIK